MLSEDKNRLLTQVGPGTPMGKLLRSYWTPIGAVSEFDDKAVRAARLFGEDLALYKDLSGAFGLVDRNCPHRRADLSLGFVEDCGLRCNYHGWLFDKDGTILEQPFEDTAHPEIRMKDKFKIKSYPVREMAGLLWAYMGEGEPPVLPVFEPFTWSNGFRQIIFADIPCNWAQCQENSIDPVHFEWMHANWSIRLKGGDQYGPKHVKLGFDTVDHGYLYKRVREDTDEEHDLWTAGRTTLWPIGIYVGDHFEWRVPVDDENTFSITWYYQRMPKEAEPYDQGDSVPHWYGPIKHPDGAWINSHVMNQDFIAWIGQGVIADRTQEHLAASDQGVAMMRRQFFADIEAVARGEDPKAIIRDPAKARVDLQIVHRERMTEGMPREELLVHPILGRNLHIYPYQYGQPREIQEAVWAAAGVTPQDIERSKAKVLPK